MEKSRSLKNFIDFYFVENMWKRQIGSFCCIITDECDHSCKYCYYKKHSSNFFNDDNRNEINILKNLDIILSWLDNQKYQPPVLEIFSGEVFSSEVGFKCFERLVDYMDEKQTLLVPTNMSFIFEEKKIERVLEIKRKKPNVILSASVDGIFMEDNRTLKSGIRRNEKYYDRLFSFCKENGVGFHPMIYSNRIDKWKENFLWFMDNYKKYDLPISSLYLLQVRNPEWSSSDCRTFMEFIDFLVHWLWDYCFRDKKTFLDFLFNEKGFNILVTLFTESMFGIGCSIQSTFEVTLGDLTIPPCHRLAYKNLLGGKFIVENNKVVDIEDINPSFYTNIICFDAKTQPFCEICLIKDLCTKGCLGAQYEFSSNVFAPIPTVCRLEYAKVFGLLRAYKKIGVLSDILLKLDYNKRKKILFLEMENMI
jgi:sulfatase maturation enzyme AslB (radical SAM superfamily)